MSYYILLQNNRYPELPTLLDCPNGIDPTEWVKGTEMADPGTLRFRLPAESTDSRGDIIGGIVTLFHDDLVAELNKQKITNVQYFPIEIEGPDGMVEEGYSLINVIGMIDALDHDGSIFEKTATGTRLKSFRIDPEKAKGHRIFRIPEAPSLIMIDSSLKISLQISELAGCLLLPTSGYDDLLEYAVEGNNTLSVKSLLAEGVSPNIRTLDWEKPVILGALKNKNIEMIEILLKGGAGIKSILPNWNPHKKLDATEILQSWENQVVLDKELFQAVAGEYSEKNIVTIETLLKRGANPNWQDSDNESTITQVLESWDKNFFTVVELLVEHGADLNLRDDTRYPIQNALWARRSSPALMQYFLDNGAQRGIDAALATAIERNELELVRILINHIDDIDWCESASDNYLGLCGRGLPL